MSLKEYYEMTVDITAVDGRSGIGKVNDYIFPEDNENGMESIIVDFPDGTAQEFYKSDIKSIRII